jgi:hypothetical protein
MFPVCLPTRDSEMSGISFIGNGTILEELFESGDEGEFDGY